MISRDKDTKVFFFHYFHRMNRLWMKRWFRAWSAEFGKKARHPLAAALQRKYPRLFRFVLLRFDPYHFRGLPLSMLVLGVGLNALILSSLAEEIRELSWWRRVDDQLALFFFNFRDPDTAGWIYRFTRIGSSPTVLSLIGFLTFIAVWRRRFHAWISIVACLLLSAATAGAGKVYYKFPRPKGLAWYEEISYSFPSGHATVAMAYYGILFYLLLMMCRSHFQRMAVAVTGVGFILFMGFSRIYLGVHYFSDVIGGFAIGLVWLLFSIALLGWLDFRKDHRV